MQNNSPEFPNSVTKPLLTGLGNIGSNSDSFTAVSAILETSPELRQFATIADHCSEFIGICDESLRPFYVNPAGLQLVGLDSVEEALSVKVSDFFFPEDWERLEKEFVPVVLANGQAETEVRFRHFKTGAEIWMIYNVFVIRDQFGKSLGLATFSQHINERKLAEKSLAEKDERLRAALTASGTGTFRWNIQTNELDWDENLDGLFGLPMGKTVRSLEKFIATVHPDDQQGVISRCRACAENGADFEMEFRVIWPDGSEHWLYDKGKTFFDATGRPWYMTGACVDITERKRKDEAIVRSEEKFRSLFEAIDEAFMVIEPVYRAATDTPADYRVLEVNEAFSRHSGFHNVVGKTLSEIVPNVDTAPSFENYARVLRTGEAVRFERVHEDRSQIFDVFVSRLGNNGSYKLAVLFNNITAKRRAEQAFSRTEQLAAAGRMAAVVAHEINNPLECVVNLIYLLQHEVTTDKGNQFLSMAANELERVMHIAKQTLSFYRAASRPGIVDVPQVVSEVVSSLKILSPFSGIEFEIDAKESVSASVHQNELRQVVMNLLLNSVEADSSHIKVRIHPSQDWKDASRPGVRISVCDNGKGIPRERLPLIFEPFYTTKDMKGTGLGLWVSKGIVAKHGGSVRLRSSTADSNRGTCLSIFFPAVNAAAAA